MFGTYVRKNIFIVNIYNITVKYNKMVYIFKKL